MCAVCVGFLFFGFSLSIHLSFIYFDNFNEAHKGTALAPKRIYILALILCLDLFHEYFAYCIEDAVCACVCMYVLRANVSIQFVLRFVLFFFYALSHSIVFDGSFSLF